MNPEIQLESFLDKYPPDVAALARAAMARLCETLQGATRIVYDNYNALAIGFGADERTSNAIFSIAVYPRWVNFFFLQGARLPDPSGILKGSGNVVRHIRLATAADLDLPAVRDLISLALAAAETPIDPAAPPRLVVKSVSAKQRPRRPV